MNQANNIQASNFVGFWCTQGISSLESGTGLIWSRTKRVHVFGEPLFQFMFVAVNLLVAHYFGTFASKESSEDFTTKGSNIKFVPIVYLQSIQIC